VLCSHCGEKNLRHANFCSRCGNPTTADSPAGFTFTANRRDGSWESLKPVVAVVLILGLLLGWGTITLRKNRAENNAAQPAPNPVSPGGNVQAPKKVTDVNPIYPAAAQSARVEGVVLLEASIGVDGRVEDVKVVKSIPLLDGAAVDAVKQWVYTPTLVKGVPVAVVMRVTVDFKLR
jgi:TonB family protein